MGLPAQKFEVESTMEQRVATLEANVEHIRSDISEMKGDIRRLDSKIDSVKDSLMAALTAFQAETRENRWKDKFWWIAIALSLLGVMAKGFRWV